jgi:tetraacyldisaccharide 4'-kinase
MIKYLRLLLFPLSLAYGLVVVCRNKLYDLGLLKSSRFNLPVICIGNLVVGGSGKSPVTEYLVQLLAGHKIAILSRGYGRNTRGFILADESATAESIGDEPMQFYRKFPNITVAVCEDRVKGINQLKNNHDLILLDDAFQHRAVAPGFSILLFEYEKLLKPQFLLPAGNLREPFSGYQRAQLLMVTKAPEQLEAVDKSKCLQQFADSPAGQPVFSYLRYGNLMPLFSGQEQSLTEIPAGNIIFLLTGIANPAPMVAQLVRYSRHIQHYNYPDHHQFSIANIRQLVHDFNNQYPKKEKLIITTEKDAQRLLAVTLKELLLNLPIYYLPIKIALQNEDKATFDQKILEYVSSSTRNR